MRNWTKELLMFPSAITLVCLSFFLNHSNGYVPAPLGRSRISNNINSGWRRQSFPSILQVSSVDDAPPAETINEEPDDEDIDPVAYDEFLIETTAREKFVDLCTQCGLSIEGTKKDMLYRLRNHAESEAAKEQARIDALKNVIEDKEWDANESYEIVGEFPEEEDQEGYFYYPISDEAILEAEALKGKSENGEKLEENEEQEEEEEEEDDEGEEIDNSLPKPAYMDNRVITAPPPPDTEPDENGERVVTVYNSEGQNDLTGIAAAQPGHVDNGDNLSGLNLGASEDVPWDMEKSTKGKASSEEIEKATEEVTELINKLLATSGAPGFQNDPEDILSSDTPQRGPTYANPKGFVGFDPTKVNSDLLVAASKSLRTGRGQVLQDVLRQFELYAIGHDGKAGDDVSSGGGHYREVVKVRSFVEGFRRAEVRRLARETTTMLLDKLAQEGLQGLDVTLATMTRSSDDTSDVGGELNDSLLDFLNDVIRHQEKKVERSVTTDNKINPYGAKIEDIEAENVDDPLEKVWNVTNEEGQHVETLDPSDLKVKRILRDEFDKTAAQPLPKAPIPEAAPGKVLLLLKLLRERIKAEASFSGDEKGRNLRMLAYCMRLPLKDREQLIMKEYGSSSDALDSFAELIASSIEYGESTSHQLQPSKTRGLHVPLLKSILALVEDIKDQQTWKPTSGGGGLMP